MTTTIPPQLKGTHLRTYEKLFQHPVSHNLEWREVLTMLGRLGQVIEEPNGHVAISRNGHTLSLHRSHSKDITDVHELMEIRHFLERSGTPLPPAADQDSQMLVVISHHEAKVFHSIAHGTSPDTLKSNESRYVGHAADSKETSRGKEIPSPGSYFEPLAVILKNAGKILFFGGGSGNSSEMEVFVTWLQKHHLQISTRIIGSVVAGEHQLSDGELLSKAREFYTKHQAVSG
jgi:hypothetical protein